MGKKKKHDELEEYKDVTVANMNVDGMPWYRSPEEQKDCENMRGVGLTKEERRAMIKGAYKAMLPAFLIGLAVFSAAFAVIILFLAHSQ